MPDRFFLYLFVMAGVTYLIRALPLTLFRREIRNRFVRSFLAYVPYAVLAAMTIPDILYSTSNFWSAAAGLAVGFVLAFLGRSLLMVAGCASLVVFIVERFL